MTAGAASVAIVRHGSTPSLDLGSLFNEAASEGHRFVARAATEWANGSNRFDQDGEGLFLAFAGEHTIGMCGLNIDPFLDDPTVGRLRHLYVTPHHRKAGIGRRLVCACLELADGSFRRVRLRTFDRMAAQFYEDLGFAAVGEQTATHSIRLGR